MAFLTTWDETFPSDLQLASLGADDIRNLTKAVRERLAVDHYALAVEGSDPKIGYHKSATLLDATNDLLGVTGAVRLYGKTINGKVEVFLVMADNTVIQLTSNGKLNSKAIDGIVPIANLASGTPDGTKFIRDDGTLAFAYQNPAAGMVVQVVNVETGAYAIGTTVIPYDDSIPQNNEGDEYMTLSITPKSATNKLKIEVVLNSNSANHQETVALFQDSIADALAAINNYSYGGSPYSKGFTHFMVAGTTSPITFKVRAGSDSAYAVWFNGYNGVGRRLGGVYASSITITEVQG